METPQAIDLQLFDFLIIAKGEYSSFAISRLMPGF